MQDQKQFTQTDSSQTLKPLASLLPSVLTQPQSSQASETGQPPRANVIATGKPPSETILGGLRTVAQNAQRGQLLDDRILETLLVQHFGSQRFETKQRLKHIYNGPNGYDYDVEGYDVQLDGIADDEMKLYDAVEYLNRPASGDFVNRQVSRMRVVLARAGESNEDMAILIDTYIQHLAEFPPDVVKASCDKIIADHKWFPLISEMRREMNKMVAYRRSLWAKFQALRNPLLAEQEKQKQLASDPRLGVHWKQLPRKQWMAQHYDWWIGEAEDMLRQAELYPNMLNVEMWTSEVEGRRADKAKAGF